MRALFARSGIVEITEVPLPEAGPGQVRVKVAAAAVQPVDLATTAGALADYGLTRKLDVFALGWEVAGTVDQVGQGVALSVGDEVFGLSDRLEAPLKTQADYVVLDANEVARAPRGLSPAQATTLPLTALTAGQALDLAGLAPGQTLLVTGAAGGLGGHLVELAALRGLRVVALAGEADEELVRGFGAEWFVPRERLSESPRDADLAAVVRALVPGGVDGAVDAAVLGHAAFDAVRSSGVIVHVLAGVALPHLRGIRVETVLIKADGERLAEVARLAEQGRLTARVAGTYPLDQAAEAQARLAEGGLRGRLVLVP
ncbi:NADP-dependent oxidoreductase [Nonomuraea sp. NPDC050556]|uniref:NADP-dependent oxidoreductase n=1 Tax=Nonomuraea sp. NPDC050556 TaxID=3364369 RepID=UPI00379EBED3